VVPAPQAPDRRGIRLGDNCGVVVYLAGEWVPAWLWMSMAFLVATLGVAGLGWWVVRGDARNRATEEALLETETETAPTAAEAARH
jgi:hypothetical protein